MRVATEGDYVLGTDEEELERLGLQHRVWRPVVLDCWQRAGITAGKRVLDVGAGPGYAAMDLAEIVGPRGEVTAIERSPKFLRAMEQMSAQRGITNLRIHQLDLMEDDLPALQADFAWCRWVLCFVSDPASVVRKIAGALAPNGIAIFHEYMVYPTWSFLPPRPVQRKFVERVMASWRASGGEPDMAAHLPKLLTENGFTIRSVRPHVFVVRPSDYMWQWPATYVESGSVRMEELGHLDAAHGAELRAEFAAAATDPETLMITPLMGEIIAQRDRASHNASTRE
ncbi:MAG: class I SAM-dependent methyltransferase [Verrucomicrobia bacterium]|nr:class I SAM-dependent methyltransferase [Verrucomicrobiota bacterium]